MTGADVGIGWVDATGKTHFQDRFAYNFSRPIIDKTTNDWFALQGREQDGWTAIQFNRRLNTCDSMDVPIKSGTNVLIYAYGLVDPDGDITYHEDRRGSRMIPLQSYTNPPTEDNVNYNYGDVMQWIKSIEWTPTIAAQWQEFFNNAPRHIYYGLTENLSWEKFDMPKYKDLETESCPMVLVPNIEKLG
ncbi:unnamed protein product [Rotaria sp. Silwood1]|nr:unnamed protein product [Rotaria sp. Silwood1]